MRLIFARGRAFEAFTRARSDFKVRRETPLFVVIGFSHAEYVPSLPPVPAPITGVSPADESIACVVQRISNTRYLGVADVRDGTYVVDGSALDPQLVFDEGNSLLAWDSAALWFLSSATTHACRFPSSVMITSGRAAIFCRRAGGCPATGDQHGNESGEEDSTQRRRNSPGDCFS